jgi:hypothetical protein
MVVAVYTGVLMLAPGFHHDFSCHENSRTHCTSCLSNQSAPNVTIFSTPGCEMIRLSMYVEVAGRSEFSSQPRFCDSGRAPPA